MVYIFQTLFFLFSFVAISSIYRKKKGGLLGAKGMLFWVIFWIAADIAVIWPNSTTVIANHLGIGRGTDLVLYLSFVLNFYLLFKLHVKVESVGRDVTRVVRRNSLGTAANPESINNHT